MISLKCLFENPKINFLQILPMPKKKIFSVAKFFFTYLDIVLVYFEEEELFLNVANSFFIIYLGECCTKTKMIIGVQNKNKNVFFNVTDNDLE